VLRATRALLDARIGPKRIAEVVRDLRHHLTKDRDVSSLRLSIDGADIVVADAGLRWHLESGQMLLALDRPQRSAPVQATFVEDDRAAYRAFTRGLALEPLALEEAREAYREALRLDPTAVPALVNLGRLEHEAGDLDAAEEHYRAALSIDAEERTAAFNLALVAEDRGQTRVAVQRYRQLLSIDPDHADAHHRLARLLGKLGRQSDARRHMRLYRRLARGGRR
jgi:tetratricopeptide (TPR) repeat protein